MFFNFWFELFKECLLTRGNIAGAALHPQIVPYDLLTDKEKFKNRERSQELLKYLQFMGYKLLRFDLPLHPPHIT
jgi:RyR domain